MKMRCLAGLAVLVAASAAAADTITVCLDGSCDFTDIQAAIDFANDGDVVQISNETYYPKSTISIAEKSISIKGTVDESMKQITAIDGQESIQIFDCLEGNKSLIHFERITFQNGFKYDGGSAVRIRNYVKASFESCVFTGNRTNPSGPGHGGAIHAGSHSQIQFNDCKFIDNIAGTGGAVLTYGETQLFTNCMFSENLGNGGSCIYFLSTLTIDMCTFTNNSAQTLFGSVFATHTNPPGTLTMTNSVLCNNSGKQIYIKGGWEDDGSNCVETDCGCDMDGDGNLDTLDNCPSVANPDQNDCDLDGIGDTCELDCDTDGNPDDCEIAGGEPDVNLNGIPDTCECITDIDGNGTTDGTDLSYLLSGWGSDGSLIDGLDIYKDGTIDGTDLSYLLAAWGVCPCPPPRVPTPHDPQSTTARISFFRAENQTHQMNNRPASYRPVVFGGLYF